MQQEFSFCVQQWRKIEIIKKMRKIQLYPVNHEYMKNGREEKDIPVIVDLWERRKMSGWTVYFEFGEPMKLGIKWKGIIE